MSLTNALDDSDYVADPEFTDVQYLRHLAELLPDITTTDPMLDAKRLNEIADRLSELEPAPNDFRGEGYEVNSRLAPADPQIECRGFDLRTQGRRWTEITANEALELTSEMSLPPDFDASDPVAVWDVHHDRDLVAEIRAGMSEFPKIPVSYGELLDGLDDMDFAMHLQNCGEFLDVHIDTLAEAVSRVRANPSDGIYRE